MEKEPLIQRIRKLLALSKSSNEHEAKLAMQKVNELMTEHQIEMSEVLIKEAQTFKAERGKPKFQSEVYRSFIQTLANAAAYLFDTSVLIHGKCGISFVGLKEDIVASEILFDYLFESWKSIVAHDTKNWKYETFGQHGWEARQYEVKQYKTGHGQGFSQTVRDRAYALHWERKAKVKAAGGNQLVVLKDQLIADEIKNVPVSKGRGFIDQDGGGYLKGKSRGKDIPLSGALAEDKKRLEG